MHSYSGCHAGRSAARDVVCFSVQSKEVVNKEGGKDRGMESGAWWRRNVERQKGFMKYIILHARKVEGTEGGREEGNGRRPYGSVGDFVSSDLIYQFINVCGIGEGEDEEHDDTREMHAWVDLRVSV